ncbi:hypothetical protein [Paenibacillus contaminans]|uniref:BclA C-terminal domain-containing protein n=1 Tax=Paenibacillus contaminans TaxID=450362 RepID=A0A329MJE8_9BACL|nr:hypothetical protein [Paenibacillus contaminans]RAV19979.1 hypothetical protein DQG23_18855 [Paenibacillus contaminans]
MGKCDHKKKKCKRKIILICHPRKKKRKRNIIVVPGPPGPPGPSGTFTPVYAFIFDNADQTLTKTPPGSIARFNQFNQPGSVAVGGILVTANSIAVPVAGDYAVLWEVTFLATDANHQHAAFGVFVNGVLQDSTRSGEAIFMQQQVGSLDGDAILSLQAGDVLTLRSLIPAASTQNDIPLTSIVQYPGANQPINSASLRVVRLSPS